MGQAERQANDAAMSEVRNFIAGEYRNSSAAKTFDNVDPCTGNQIGVVHEATREDVDAAVNAARDALKGPWGSMTDADRSELLYAIADGVDKRFDEFLEAECLDTGKPYSIASHIDIPRGAANFRVFADAVKTSPPKRSRCRHRMATARSISRCASPRV